MSSRAIIARCIKNGYFTSWCWVNGDPDNIGKMLRAHFVSEDDVEELISYKSILGIFKDPADDNNKNISGTYTQLKNGLYVKYDDGMDTVVSGGLEGFFPSLTIMMQEMVHHIYIFDNGTWKTYNVDSNNINYSDERKAEYKNNESTDSQDSSSQKNSYRGHALKKIRQLKDLETGIIREIIRPQEK